MLLSNDTLLNRVWRFPDITPKGYQTRRPKVLALSRAILCHGHANRRRLFPPQISCIPCSSSLPPIDRSTSRLQLICLFAHNRYGTTIPGRLFTSAALKHLASDDSELPDLMLHRGSAAVPECNNPDLFPGIHPMLFRWVRHS